MREKPGTRGFTLIELLTVIAIVAIIAAIAIPAYNNQIQKTRRADAVSGLLEAAQRLERCFTRTNTYAGCNFDNESPDGFYAIELDPDNSSATAYRLLAIPDADGPQTSDACGTFALDHLGNREAGGTAGDRCWGSN